jgi:DNA helicase-2/ATP-dependent DNA helicase PcrA
LELQLELTRRNIPFSITSGIRFFEQAHIKDVIAHVKLVANPQDELSFKRIVKLLPGIGGKAAERLWTCYQAGAVRLAGASETPNSPVLGQALQACSDRVPKRTTVAWAQLSATLAQLEAEAIRNKPSEMIRLVVEAGYDEYARENFKNYESRLEDLEQLANFSLQFQGTNEFLTELALQTNLEAEEDRPVGRDDEQIRLSTIHQAKGLEFGVVFIIMLCDGLFPAGRSIERIEDEEEERRLFYVAITRAKRELYLSYPVMRRMAGNTRDAMQVRSRFLRDLPEELLESWNLRPYGYAGADHF